MSDEDTPEDDGDEYEAEDDGEDRDESSDDDASDDEDDEDGEDGEDDSTEDSRPTGRSGRTASATRRTPSTGRSSSTSRASSTSGGDSPREAKAKIDKIDDRERRFGYAAALGAVFFGVMLYVVDTHNKHFRVAKGQFTPQTALIVSLVAAVLLVVVTRVGKRSLFAFVAFLTGLSFGQSLLVLGLPFLVLGGWSFYRSFKMQKEISAEAREARAEARSKPGSSRPSSSTSGSRTASAKSTASTGPKRPEANKRYTPKRPPPPPPKPTRKERRAAAKE